MLSLLIHAGFEASNHYTEKKLQNPLTRIIYFFCNVATLLSRMKKAFNCSNVQIKLYTPVI